MDTYKLDVFCTNCDFEGSIDIPKGTVVESHKCPSCDNLTLKKKEKPISFVPHTENYI